MSDEEKTLHVVELRATNILGLRAVRIKPGGDPVVIIGGDNGEGKTSVLNTIEIVLGGKKGIPPDPVRHGARKASGLVKLGDELTVERTFTVKAGETKTVLTVKNADGVVQKSPQAILDALCKKVTFDPVAFARQKPEEQDETLKTLCNLDFAELDAKRKRLYEARAEVNRDAKRIEAQAEAATHYDDAPGELVSVVELALEVETAEGKIRDLQALRDRARDLDRNTAGLERKRKELGARVKAIEAELKEAREGLPQVDAELDAANRDAMDKHREIKDFVDPGVAAIRESLRTVEETNDKVRANQKIAALDDEVEELKDKASGLTSRIEDIDAEKSKTIAEAKMPIEGLGFEDVGVTLNGIPFEQVNSADKLRASVAIGAALNPRVKVMLIREGSNLDAKGMKLLAELAAETGSQVWLERVGDGDEAAVIIEDGEVRDA